MHVANRANVHFQVESRRRAAELGRPAKDEILMERRSGSAPNSPSAARQLPRGHRGLRLRRLRKSPGLEAPPPPTRTLPTSQTPTSSTPRVSRMAGPPLTHSSPLAGAPGCAPARSTLGLRSWCSCTTW